MPFPGQSWPLDFKVVACLFHVLAIISGIFRSTYRWYISRFGWDDTWASLALLTDVGCLICVWAQGSVPLRPSKIDIVLNWFSLVTLTSVTWEARLSMISAIIRITSPRVSIQRTSYAVAISFGLMWIAIFVQKCYDCVTRLCLLRHTVLISQLITDGVSDILLVVMPVLFLKGVKISRGQRVLLVSSFASSICITILSIAQFVLLLQPITGTSLLFTHIKVALSVVICNLLVIVTFVYRVYHNVDVGIDGITEPIQFTTVIPTQLNPGSCTPSVSMSSPCIHCSQIAGCKQVQCTTSDLQGDRW